MSKRVFRRRVLWPIASVLTWVGVRVVERLPLRLIRGLGAVGGAVLFRLPENRRIVLANLAIAFPDWDDARRREIGRRSVQSLVRGFLESVWVLRRPGRLGELALVPPEVRSQLEALKAAAPGLIMISPHLGNWELGNYATNASGFRTEAVASAQHNPWLNAWVRQGRTAAGGGIIYEKGAAKEMLKALRSGRTVAMLVDQNTKPQHGGQFADFFGLPVTSSRAPATFARHTGADICLAACVREADGRYILRVWSLHQAPAACADEAAICREINRRTEDIIREYPDQYLWLYRRFKFIPADWRGDRQRYPYYAWARDEKPQ